jgi:hypothetical protein
MLVDLITIILGYKEIDRFKDDKSQRYYEVLIEVAKLEKESSERVFIKQKFYSFLN